MVRSAALDVLLALTSQLVRAQVMAGTSFVPHRARQIGSALGLDIGSALGLDIGSAWEDVWEDVWEDAWQEARARHHPRAGRT